MARLKVTKVAFKPIIENSDADWRRYFFASAETGALTETC